MQVDSLYFAKIESLLDKTSEISYHTDAWGSGLSITLTVLTIFASAVTVVGLVSIFFQIQSNKTTKKRQELIIIDLVRHLFINAILLEIVRTKMNGKWKTHHPAEGTFTRFCVLETDLGLDKIRVKDVIFSKLHSMSLSLRNYNIANDIAEKVLNDPKMDSNEKLYYLDDIWKRTKRLIDGFLKLCEQTNLKVDKESIGRKIYQYYWIDERNKVEESGKRLPNVSVKREDVRAYFSDQFGVANEFDFCIKNRYNDVRLFSF